MPEQTRKILQLKVPGADTSSDVVYRVVMNTLRSEWNIFRNGVRTSNARRKKQSAIDLAIRSAQVELPSVEGKILVTTFERGKLTTEWSSA
jgi:hypothetical protein